MFFKYLQILKTQKQEQPSPQEILKESGFIGSFKAKKNLSVTYKSEITKSLKTKHDIK